MTKVKKKKPIRKYSITYLSYGENMIKTSRTDRRTSITNYKHWVYALLKENNLVYVGVTADPAGRLASHLKNKDFDEMRLVKGFSSREKADRFERFSIKTLRPNFKRNDFERTLGTSEDF